MLPLAVVKNIGKSFIKFAFSTQRSTRYLARASEISHHILLSTRIPLRHFSGLSQVTRRGPEKSRKGALLLAERSQRLDEALMGRGAEASQLSRKGNRTPKAANRGLP